MRPARVGLVAGTVAAVALAGVLSGQSATPVAPMQIERVTGDPLCRARPLPPLCPERLWRWDHTVSTVAFKGGLQGYYDEMKAQLSK